MIGNVEGDELLMATCMSVGKREYYIEFPNGTEYKLHGRYKVNGRFNRASVEKQLAKLGKDKAEKCELKLRVSYDGKEELAVFVMKKQIRKLYQMTGCKLLNFYIGDTEKSNFRFASAVTQPYKGGRLDKPSILPYLRDYLIHTEGAIVATGYEADDMLGIHQTNETIAIHCDKDINMIPGKHYDTMKDLHWISTDPGQVLVGSSNIKGYGLSLFYGQLLMGDRTDAIPPIARTPTKGWGVKGVVDLLQKCKDEKELLHSVVKCYKESLGEDKWRVRIREQADLVWICRDKHITGSRYIVNKLMEHNL